MCWGIISDCFHIIGDGHQPNSRGLCTYYKVSLSIDGMPIPIIRGWWTHMLKWSLLLFQSNRNVQVKEFPSKVTCHWMVSFTSIFYGLYGNVCSISLKIQDEPWIFVDEPKWPDSATFFLFWFGGIGFLDAQLKRAEGQCRWGKPNGPIGPRVEGSNDATESLIWLLSWLRLVSAFGL